MSDIETTQTRLPVMTANALIEKLIAERDALRSQVQEKDARLEFLRREIGSLVNDRHALRAVLTEIVDEFHQTYDATSDGDTWKGAAQINAHVMERAERLVSK